MSLSVGVYGWLTVSALRRQGVASFESMIDRNGPTKVLDASIAGTQVAKPNWNGLLDDMVRRAVKDVKDFGKLRQICPVNRVKGKKSDEGYNHLPDIDVSIQGQDANGACRGIVTAAQALGIPVDIGFMWRHKHGAAHPGERARLRAGTNAGKRAA